MHNSGSRCVGCRCSTMTMCHHATDECFKSRVDWYHLSRQTHAEVNAKVIPGYREGKLKSRTEGIYTPDIPSLNLLPLIPKYFEGPKALYQEP